MDIFDDDVFGSSASLEKTHIEEGYADGYADGLILGRRDGYEVGLEFGFQTGEEIGFYRGIVDVWTSAIRVDPNFFFSTRVRKSVNQMRDLLDKYNGVIMNPEDESKDDIMERLRLKFRTICATLGVKNFEYNGYPKSSHAQEFEF